MGGYNMAKNLDFLLCCIVSCTLISLMILVPNLGSGYAPYSSIEEEFPLLSEVVNTTVVYTIKGVNTISFPPDRFGSRGDTVRYNAKKPNYF